MRRGEADTGTEVDHPLTIRRHEIESADGALFEAAAELRGTVRRDRVTDDIERQSALRL
jgi:hypothetical protein